MKRLGRGISDILNDIESSYIKDLGYKVIENIEINKIKSNPFQPRKEFNQKSIEELANSIKKYGLMQPILVIKEKENYILVAGERRVKAFKYLNIEKIDAIIVDYSLKDLQEYALIENIQRDNLTTFEIAMSLKSLKEEFNYTYSDLANTISKSQSYVSNLLRVLKLPKHIINKLENGSLTIGHAKVLVNLDNNIIDKIVERIEKDNLSVRETEELINELKTTKQLNFKNIETLLKKNNLKFKITNKEIRISIKNLEDLKKIEKLFKLTD